MQPLDRLLDSGVVAVLRGVDPDVMGRVVDALVAGGVTAIEITADGRDASGTIAEVVPTVDDDVLVGAGTVMDAAAASRVIEAGASFVVSPHLDPDVIEIANRRTVPVAPGVLTPTEAADGLAAGADFLKIFPASTVGPGHLAAIQGPLGAVPIMPTGGVDADNVRAFFDAGADVVGVGSALLDDDAIERGDYDAVEQHAREFVETVEKAR